MNDDTLSRRAIDAELSENMRDYRNRQNDVAERLARVDEALKQLRIEFDAGRQSRLTIQEQQTGILERLTNLSSRLMEHLTEEAQERKLINETARAVALQGERINAIADDDIERLEEQFGKISAFIEALAGSMNSLASRFEQHALMEESQWGVVNKSNTNIETLTTALNQHITEACGLSTRVDWIERTLYGLVGGVAALMITLLSTRMMG
jgi:archaellum component FlaC